MAALRIGTRGSELALWQAREVARLLEQRGIASSLQIIHSTGDKRTDVPLAQIGGKGLFVKELEEALIEQRIDLAVHSLKDVPSTLDDTFALTAFLERADPRDAWFHPAGLPIVDLPAGAVVGTSAPRRAAQIRHRFPRLETRPIRGNVPTRIEKMRRGEYDAIVLAVAGVSRLGRAGEISSIFSIEEMVPAAGQGIVAIETLAHRHDLVEILAGVNHEPSALAARCERGVLHEFGTNIDCYSSIAVHAQIGAAGIRLDAFVSNLDGTSAIRETISTPTASIEHAVKAMAGRLEARGALRILTSRETP